MVALVLAGGLGTRLRGLVKKVPKPMAPVHGRPFLEYLLDYWQGQGVRNFVLGTGYRQAAVKKHFGRRYGGANIRYSEEKQPLGTGGGLLRALGRFRLGPDFLVLNGDTFFEVDLKGLRRFHERRGADATLALASQTGRRYERIVLGAQGRIRSIRHRGRSERTGWINGGVYLFNRRLFRGRKTAGKLSLESEMLPEFLKQGKKLFGCRVPGRFIDIGTPASYKAAGKFFKER